MADIAWMRRKVLLSAAVATMCVPAAPASAANVAPAPSASRLVTCGEQAFELSALRGPKNQPKGRGPLSDAMRAYLRDPFPMPMPRHGWRLLRKTAHRALFGLGHPPSMTTVLFVRRHGRWSWMTWADGCHLRAVRRGLTASAWRLDPAHPAPGHDARTLHVLVREHDCASGRDARGRIQRPSLWVNPRRIAIAMYVTPLAGTRSCQGVPETPATVRLPVALGTRKLFDVGFVPSHRRR